MDFKNLNNYLDLKLSNNEPQNLNKPNLIVPGVKYFFNGVLKECNDIKKHNYNLFYNIFFLVIFLLILGTILIFKNKGNKTKEEMYQKNLKDKQYIMSKLVYYNRQNLENQQKIKNNMITNLPDYGNHPEASLLHRKIYF